MLVCGVGLCGGPAPRPAKPMIARLGADPAGGFLLSGAVPAGVGGVLMGLVGGGVDGELPGDRLGGVRSGLWRCRRLGPYILSLVVLKRFVGVCRGSVGGPYSDGGSRQGASVRVRCRVPAFGRRRGGLRLVPAVGGDDSGVDHCLSGGSSCSVSWSSRWGVRVGARSGTQPRGVGGVGGW